MEKRLIRVFRHHIGPTGAYEKEEFLTPGEWREEFGLQRGEDEVVPYSFGEDGLGWIVPFKGSLFFGGQRKRQPAAGLYSRRFTKGGNRMGFLEPGEGKCLLCQKYRSKNRGLLKHSKTLPEGQRKKLELDLSTMRRQFASDAGHRNTCLASKQPSF